MKIYLSKLDQQRFGIIVAKGSSITSQDIATVETFCVDNEVQLSIVRVRTSDLPAVQQLETIGYHLMDTLVYYAFKFNKNQIPEDTNPHHIRPVQAKDTEAVGNIATESFKGYFGHYHADSRLPKEKCDEVYIDWAKKSVTLETMADNVLVVEKEGRLDGFATLRQNSDEEGEGILFGVAPHAQGQGIYRTMMIYGMQWCKDRGHKRMVVSTQVTNIAVQKVWARLGFEMDHAYYTLHKWF